MSLLSIGRNAAIADMLHDVHSDVHGVASTPTTDKLQDARKSLLQDLTPWIPGDFVVTYGVLLTAWSGMRASFGWLLVVAAAAAVTYVTLGAFAVTGFTGSAGSPTAMRRLTVRTVVGFGVSVYTAVAIPNSGWYDFKWFADHELPCVVTAAAATIVVVSLLRGFQKRYGFQLGNGQANG